MPGGQATLLYRCHRASGSQAPQTGEIGKEYCQQAGVTV